MRYGSTPLESANTISLYNPTPLKKYGVGLSITSANYQCQWSWVKILQVRTLIPGTSVSGISVFKIWRTCKYLISFKGNTWRQLVLWRLYLHGFHSLKTNQCITNRWYDPFRLGRLNVNSIDSRIQVFHGVQNRLQLLLSHPCYQK
jgi:hypothetical protein